MRKIERVFVWMFSCVIGTNFRQMIWFNLFCVHNNLYVYLFQSLSELLHNTLWTIKLSILIITHFNKKIFLLGLFFFYFASNFLFVCCYEMKWNEMIFAILALENLCIFKYQNKFLSMARSLWSVFFFSRDYVLFGTQSTKKNGSKKIHLCFFFVFINKFTASQKREIHAQRKSFRNISFS